MNSAKPIALLLIYSFFLVTSISANNNTADDRIYKQAQELLAVMTLDEKVSLLSGRGSYDTQNIDRLNLPSLQLWDGPNGVRSNNNEPATAFPVGICMGSTWNPALIEKLGKALGKECRAFGVEVLLGPTMNIIRTPLNGRNFETFSEDPFFSGVMGTAYVKGLQSENVGASVKHFIANNQETNRQSVSAEISERTLREIYLPAYRRVIKEAQPFTIMAAYNQINGGHATENNYIMNSILRKEYGFTGVLLSDWGGVKSTIQSLNASLDLEMPGPGNYYEKPLRKALKKGTVTVDVIDQAALRMIQLILKTTNKKPNLNDSLYQFSDVMEINKTIARKVAEESVVLLKNENKLLPINTEKVRSIAIIGPNANRSINQGGGSARVTAAYSVTPLQGITALARKNDIEVNYHKGVENHPAVPLMEAASLRLNSRSEETGLQGEYYQSYNFTGAPFKTERDEELRIFGIIDEGVFGSVLWTGDFIAKKSGEYRFSANPGLGKAKIFIDGKKVVLNEKGKPAFGGLLPAPKIGNILLSSGRHSIKVEYSAKPSFFLSFILKIVMPGVADLLKKFRFLEIGCRLPEPEISLAIDLARNADMAIIVVGSSDNYESEGEDRPSMKLTGKQDELIESILKVNQNTIVIMNTGSPIEMPWVNQSPAILQVWLPGQEGGNAIANVIFGNVNPSGKLPVTFPKKLEDNPSHGYYPGDKKVFYDEGIYVGYRHYDTKNIDPLFPFGHGLSYTKFDYGSIAGPSNITSGEKINLSITVKNSGQRKGQEVVQCYIRDLESSIDRPYQELKAFQKITLEASESKPIDILLDETALSFFDPGSNDWVTEPGQFEILIGSSSRDIRSRKIINFRY